MIDTLPEYSIGKQPCKDFSPDMMEEWFGHVRHVCPRCEGMRMFCLNCYHDHHANGWEACKKDKELPE